MAWSLFFRVMRISFAFFSHFFPRSPAFFVESSDQPYLVRRARLDDAA